MHPYWNNGCIFGFLSRDSAEALIKEASNGTCIIRMSESVPKAMAVTCKTDDGRIENKLIESTAASTCTKFVESLRKFQGNLTKVIHVSGSEITFEDAFPPVTHLLTSLEANYKEIAN